ncbi:MAG: 16S rRNA (guanine(527)-N(7))-methyltransferase RsmG [Rhizomicrobium sp.]
MPEPKPADPFGPEDFAARTGVSRETLARLKAYIGLLTDWNARHNLVSAKSLEDVWRRHIWDSAQLVSYVPTTAATLADLGSGAGFPGLILAELLRGKVRVSLFESTGKKAEFLRAVAGRLGLDVEIRNERIESAQAAPFDVVTARALAPLDKLLGYAQHLAGKRTICLFLKGQSLASELTEARKSWRMKALQHQSATDPSGVILEVRELEHAQSKRQA